MIRTAPFFAVALVLTLTLGGTLGSVLLAARHLSWLGLGTYGLEAGRMVHGHAQVFGFAALFVMGVAYHALPRLSGAPLTRPRLAKATLWLQSGGVLLYAIAALVPPWQETLAIAAALTLLVGAAAFARVVEEAVGALAHDTPAARWLRAGAWWLVVAALLDVAVACGVDALRAAVWDTALYGFVATWIFGMSMQFLPVLLGRTFAHVHTWVFAWYQLSVTAEVLATAALPVTHPLRGLAAATLAAAALAVVLDLHVFGGARPSAPSSDDGAARFLLTAYGWLLAGLVCGPGWRAFAAATGGFAPVLAEDFARHALTLGFLTQMIIGVTSRLVVAFADRPFWNDRARLATYWLLNAAVGTRALQVAIAHGTAEAFWPWIALSGPLAVLALGVFTVTVIRGARPAPAG